MEMSEQIDKLAAALAKAQGQMDNAAKDSNNPFFHSKYADLAAIMNACRGPLSENGLAFLQPAKVVETKEVVEMKWNKESRASEEVSVPYARVIVKTIIMHESGQMISEDLEAWVRGDIQGIGAGITYLRRYGLAPMVGVAAEDDDGNSAVKPRDAEFKARKEPPQEQLKENAIKILKAGAEKGDSGFAAAWKTLSEPMRRAVAAEAGAIRADAQAVDKAKEPVSNENGGE